MEVLFWCEVLELNSIEVKVMVYVVCFIGSILSCEGYIDLLIFRVEVFDFFGIF